MLPLLKFVKKLLLVQAAAAAASKTAVSLVIALIMM